MNKKLNRLLFWKLNLILIILTVLYLFFSFLLYLYLKEKVEKEIRNKIAYDSSKIATRISYRVNSKFGLINNLGAFFSSSELVSKREFGIYCKSLFENNNHIDRLMYIKYVKPGMKQAVISNSVGADISDFNIFKPEGELHDHSGLTIPGSFPVYFVEPLQKNKELIGLDLAYDKERNKVIENAFKNGRLSISNFINHTEYGLSQTKLFVALPVYNLQTDTNKITSSSDVLGLVAGEFLINDMISAILNPKEKEYYKIVIWDKQSPRSKISFPDLDGNGNVSAEMAYTYTFTIGNNEWIIRCYPLDKFLDTQKNYEPILIFLIFILFSLFIPVYIFLKIKQTRKLEGLVNKRTRELNEINRDLEDQISWRKRVEELLSESERKYRRMVEFAGDGVYTCDYNGNFTYFNPACEELSGFSMDEVIGNHYSFLVSPDAKEHVIKFYSDQFINRTPRTVLAFPIINKDGRVIWTEQTVILIEDNTKRLVVGFLCIVRDISEQKKAKDELFALKNELEERVKERTQNLKEAKRHIVQILESITDSFVALDKDWNYTYVNKKAAENFNYKPEELIGKNIWKVFPEGIGQRFYEAYQYAMKSGKSVEIEEYYEPYDKWFENRIYPTGNGIAIFFHDITDRKTAEQKILQSERLLNQAQKIAHLGYWEWDIKSGAVKWSEEIFNIYGENPETFVPDLNSYLKHVHPDEKKFVSNTVINAVANNKEYTFYQRAIRPNGELRYLKCAGKTEVNKEGEVIRLIGVCYDITDQKVAEMKVKELNYKLETKVLERTKELMDINKDLESFTYSVSHDLRAPLRNINGFARTVEEKVSDLLDKDSKELISMIRIYAAKMDKLITDLLEFSRLGKKEITRTEIDMTSLAEIVFKEVGKDMDTSHIEINIQRMPACKGDYSLLSQVYYNLLSNAVKYSVHSNPPVIEVGSNELKNEIVYFVKDNGIGFEPEKSDQVFGVFTRLNNALSYEGTGLGLAIVKKIIIKHGGKTWAEAKPGEGATFYFSLPK